MIRNAAARIVALALPCLPFACPPPPAYGQTTVDTAAAKTDTVTLAIPNKSGLDTAVTFSAKDSVVFNLRRRVFKLRGASDIRYGPQRLEADAIDISFDSGLMDANAGQHTAENGKTAYYNVPKFTDKGESFYGKKIGYNFRTRQGAVSLGETTMDAGYYFGDKIKRIDEKTLFVSNGSFTTCDEPHPHFYFSSPKMKVVANDRIFADPLIVYVEDIPIFAVPFGMFVETQKGRRSGIMIPSFFFSGAPGSLGRGIVFQNLGYYWAASDYWDTQLTADFYTKGGYLLRNATQYKVGPHLRGSLALTFGNQRFSPTESLANSWSLAFEHYQRIDPSLNVSGNVRFTSQDFIRQTSTNLLDRTQQNIYSNASVQKSFKNGIVLSANYSRSQNLLDNSLSEDFPRLSVTVPQLFPLRGLVDRNSWLSDVAVTYNVSGFRRRTLNAITQSNPQQVQDVSSQIAHNPSINISPKLGYFTVSPQITYSERWFFRKQFLSVNPADSSLQTRFDDGFFREYQYSAGLNISTRLYGIANIKAFGITSFRHTFQPQLSWTWSPGFGDASYGFYGSYFDPTRGETVRYSHFGRDGGGVNRDVRQALGLRLSNNFEVKVAQDNDTIPDKVVRLGFLDAGASYNLAADSLRLSEIDLSFRTSAADVVNIVANAGLSAYDTDLIVPASGQAFRRVVDRTYLESGKGLARLTRASLSLQTSLSGAGLSAPSQVADNNRPRPLDSLDIGSRFASREDDGIAEPDFFGDSSPGHSPFSLPWNASFFMNLNYAEPLPGQISRQLNLGASLDVVFASTWKISGSLSWDAINGQINVPTIFFSKELHDADIQFQWNPVGFSRGFYLRFGLKDPRLRDIKLEKRDNPLLR